MSSTRASSYCAACGFAQANHFSLWMDSASDVISLRIPMYRVPFYRFFLAIAEGITWALGWIFLTIGRLIGAARFSSDSSGTISDRSRLLWESAIRRNIHLEQLMVFGKPTDIFRVKHSGRTQYFTSLPLSPKPDALRMDDKVLFKEMMRKAGLPVPRSVSASKLSVAKQGLKEFGTVCVKPRTGSNGRHTYPFVHTPEQLKAAFASVKVISPTASVEEHIEGNLCRATCVGGKLIGFLESQYPSIVGDGTSTVRELIEQKNAAKAEGVEEVPFDYSFIGYIQRRGYELDDILPAGESLQLSYRGGAGSGGSNREHGRDGIHPSFIEPIERAATLTGLHIVGFDIIIPDPQQSADSQKWGFIEANSLPWIDLHQHPYSGPSIDLSESVWDLWLERQA